MIQRGFLAENARWLAAGAALTFASSFGQTFFIALFGAELRAEFGLSHGGWGAVYTAGTVGSAALLTVAGALSDRFRARALAAAVLAAYAGVCLGMTQVSGPVGLAIVVFGLRFCGQGMMSNVAMTAMARWFSAQRGRAVAIVALGFSAGEAALPAATVALMGVAPWRAAWIGAAAFLLALIPAMFWLLARERTPRQLAEQTSAPGMDGRHWTRAQALRERAFWAVSLGVLAPPFVNTALFFHQTTLAETKGWTLGQIAVAFPLYSALTIGASFAAAAAVDRYGARRLLPLYQIPMACAALALSLGDAVWVVWLVFALVGLTQGAAVALLGAIWPELFGTRHIGAIRGVAVSAMVFATAAGPGITGGLIDLGLRLETQFLGMGALSLGVCALFGALSPRLGRRLPPRA